jgi:hypothetical protein
MIQPGMSLSTCPLVLARQGFRSACSSGLTLVRTAIAPLLLCSLTVSAAVIQETFDADPATRGWRIHGDSDLFQWEAEAGKLRSTWDSDRTNTFYHLPLPTVLTRNDAFRFAFTLELESASLGESGGTFQLALGLLRRSEAFQENFFRGAGVNPGLGPRSIVEFDYFPASATITPTLSLTAVATNNLRWATRNLFPFELPVGVPCRVEVSYQPDESLLSLAVTAAGEPLASGSVTLNASFGDFRLDAFSVTSYSGANQPAGYAGEIHAVGTVDDIEIELPDPPVSRLVWSREGESVHVRTAILDGWQPRLLRSEDLVSWQPIDAEVHVKANEWLLVDPTPPVTSAVYRVILDRP